MPRSEDSKPGDYVVAFPVKGAAEEKEANESKPSPLRPKPEREEERQIPEINWDRYNVVQIGARVTQETEKQLKEANRRIEEKLGRRFGYNKVIDELVAYALDDYLKLKLKSI